MSLMSFDTAKSAKKGELIYVYDPLCGWCFGFEPVVSAVTADFKDQLDITVLSGGMVIGNRVGPLGPMADYIKQAIPRLEETCNVKFGKAYYDNILFNKSYISNSEKPCIALTVLKELKPEASMAFVHEMQQAHFVHGKDLENDSIYIPILEKLSVQQIQFFEKLKDSNYKKKTFDEFERVKAMGIQGFPCLYIKLGDKMHRLAYGYRDEESIRKQLTQLLK